MIRSRLLLEPRLPGRRPGAIVRIAGPVDAVDRGTLDRLLLDLEGIPDVRLDVSDLGFAGSAFADFLDRLDASARRAGGHVVLSNPVPFHVSRLLVLARLDERLAARAEPSEAPVSGRSER